MACKVKTNQHGNLAFRLYWKDSKLGINLKSWEGTKLKDNPENRAEAEAQAKVISREMKRGKFDYLKWFPSGNRAHLFKPPEQAEKPLTVGEYYTQWIARKVPPVVRAGLARDYKEHYTRYIAAKFENVALVDVKPPILEEFRAYLLNERGLSIKSCRNVIDASFRAMMRDARKVDYLIERDPFEALTWPRVHTLKPDPFTEAERDKVIAQFTRKSPFYVPFVYTLLYTGMRPSEALALRWGDVDLTRGFISISKSRYMSDEGSPKTAGSHREITLLPGVVEALKRIKPLRVTEDSYVFVNQDGEPLNFHTWRGGIWYRVLRGAGVKERRPYCCRHTFISVGLSNGVNIKWLAEYCGTSVAMIEKHYGRYIKSDAREQLERLLGAKTETLTETPKAQAAVNDSEVSDLIEDEGWWAHLDSNQGPTGDEPVALTN